MYYPDELVEEVRSKNDIVDVVGSYVRLKKSGANYFGLCPFHNEKSGSFSVSPHKQMFHCFGCGEGGNVFTFLMKYENYTFPEAIKVLADRVGVSLPEVEYSVEQSKAKKHRELLFEVNKEAAKFYYYLLRNEQGRLGMEYLTGRALTPETINKWGLGYSTQYSDSLVKYLRSKGYSDSLIRESGLVNYDEKRGLSDKFWNRVIFPIFDANGKVIGFGGRVMGDGKPKYLNSPETEIFDKGKNLFGLNFARSSRKNQFILCEGYMDVITMHQAGFTQAVASLGTAFTSGQANVLRRYAGEVLLLYDSDEAGVKAALRAIPILKEAGIRGKVVNLKPFKDPDEFIKNLGAEEFQKRLDEATNCFFFEIEVLSKNYNLSDPGEKSSFHREIAKKLCEFTEDDERENYLSATAHRFMIDEENLRKLVVKIAAQPVLAKTIERPKSGIAEKAVKDPNREAQRLLLTWMTEDSGLYKQLKKHIAAEDFREPLYHEVASMLFAQFEAGRINPAAIISTFEDPNDQSEVASLFNTRLRELENERDREKALRDIVIKVKRHSYEVAQSELAGDPRSLMLAIESKKVLEDLNRITIQFTNGEQ